MLRGHSRIELGTSLLVRSAGPVRRGLVCGWDGVRTNVGYEPVRSHGQDGI